ncbi:MAG: CoA transferase [Treponema sp.]|jgi:cinnamoyl-CoA:phenyllactate CoA-transferase|nr:CoA transferase [Treponema sp.]
MKHTQQPLEGVKVVELATFLAVPCAGRYLADLGAKVIKVEPTGGDPVRYLSFNEGRVVDGKPTGDLENTTWDLENAGKECIALDTKSKEGREAIEKLIAGADVFITNVRSKALLKMGLDYESLKVKYPKLVYGYVTGFGEDGPDKDLPGFDFTSYFARGGVLGTMFDKDHVPLNTVQGFGDHQVGINLGGGIVAALYRARETGKGDKVSTSLFHAAIWDVAILLQAAQYGQPSTQFPISRKKLANPLQVAHKTKDDRWIQFAVPAYDVNYDRFVKAIGREDLVGDARYYPQANLQSNLVEFYDLLASRIKEETLDYWCKTFTEADLPFARAQTWNELLRDEQAWANDYFYKMHYPTGADRALVRLPVKFMDTPLPEYKRGPYLGEHTETILARLGYSEAQIKAMMEAGAAAHPELKK